MFIEAITIHIVSGDDIDAYNPVNFPSTCFLLLSKMNFKVLQIFKALKYLKVLEFDSFLAHGVYVICKTN